MPRIDSHVHLFDTEGLNSLAWMTPDNKLYSNHRVEEFKADLVDSSDLEGVVFIETDVKSGLREEQWDLAIGEYVYVASKEAPKGFVKAIVPWAPVPAGSEGVKKYTEKLFAAYADDDKLVKGFRYLVQDKPSGTMLTEKFAQGVQWLADQGYVFDLGIDMHSGGVWQLEEFKELESKLEGVVFIVNHLTKPDLTKEDTTALQEKCKRLWTEIASSTKNKYYIKLSGGFSEMPTEVANGPVDEIVMRVRPWLSLFVDVFGKDVIIWGSDWPVSTLKMDKSLGTGDKWKEVSDVLVADLGLSENIYYETVKKAYNI